MTFPIDTDLLLRHAHWVRRLAGDVALDAEEADDLAQEVWVRALRRPPAHANALRVWLARVLARLVAGAGRTRVRRERRERAAARDEAQPSAAQVAERMVLHKRLSELVLELPAEQREAVYLRYFEDLPPREIARRAGVPVETVRTRLPRAQARPRERLQGGEGWGSWLVLVELGRRGSALAAFGGGLAMKKVLCAAAAVLVALFAWGWSTWLPRPLVPAAGADPAGVAATADDSTRTAAATRTAAVTATAPGMHAAGASPPTLAGRLLDADGHALGGTALELSGLALDGTASFTANARAGDDGGFAFQFAPAPDLHYYLAAQPHGAACHWWSWTEWPPEETKDLGEVRLDAGASLEVRVLDQAGRVLAHPWRVDVAFQPDEPTLHTWTYERKAVTRPTVAMRVAATVDALGTARLDGLAAGTVTVTATHGHARAQPASVTLEPGQPARIDLRHAGPAVERTIALRLVQPAYDRTAVDPAAVTLEGPGLLPRRPDRLLRFTDVPPGAYVVTVDDPRYRRAVRADVVPGAEPVEVILRGNATLDLRVVDHVGAGVPRYRVAVLPHRLGGEISPFGGADERRVEVAPLTERPDGRVTLDDFVPGSWRLVITRDEGPDLTERVTVAPNERRDVVASFAARGSIRGVVLEHDGITACAQVMVTAMRLPAGGTPVPAFPAAVLSGQAAMQWTDAQGRFAFASLEAGRWLVRALVAQATPVGQAVDVTAGAEAAARLTLPPAGHLDGRLLGPEGASFEKFSLWFRTEPAAGSFSRAVAADGTFRLGPVAPARGRVLLHFGSHTNPGRQLDEVTIAAGARLVRTYDVRPHWPGTVRVRVTSAGQPARDVTAWLHPTDQPPAGGYWENADRLGVATVTQVLAGRYAVTIGERSGHLWTWTAPATVEVPPGGTVACDVEVPLAAHAAQFVDAANGSPLTSARLVLFQTEPLRVQGHECRTDALGRVRLELPIGGRYLVRRHDEYWAAVFDRVQNTVRPDGIAPLLHGRPADFVWAAGADPLVVRVPALH